ncbi:hypothetical protein WH47_08497 [Habropoda laboriosa]|uniref:Uncharacterized protein n=1 Tax=Habropoda laboriosa TaxID=597456 RepID=A0A0L7QP95_9HYME|nr:PREDICTED: uncharacterized protein LOC108576830 [Habropoda laboriosa]KOC60369.1 hypothetical protein WH47_08497 [Habropoda laboriosa]
MRLPTFDGTIEHWSSFYDIFSSTIDRNDDLTLVQKLQYLRSTLTGKAAACIQSSSTTDVNYTDALQLLKEKFYCTRRIILRHCDALRNIPKLTRDSPEALGNLVDSINQHLRALKNLGESISSWDSILVSIILSKVSSDTAWYWEITLKDKKRMPSYTELLEFLEKQSNCAPASPTASPRPPRPESPRTQRPGPSRVHVFVSVNQQKCPICEGKHGIWSCNEFHARSVKGRSTAVEQASLCRNCPKKGHTPEFCRASLCRICQKRHHTLLHESTPLPDDATRSIPTAGTSRKRSETVVPLPSTSARPETQETPINTKDPNIFIADSTTNDLLVTAEISILDKDNHPIRCRVLMDTGATTNFITENLAKRLGVSQRRCFIPIGALNTLSTVAKHILDATVTSDKTNYTRTITFLTIPSISSQIPNQTIDCSALKIPRNIRLADPHFYRPVPVEALLGVGVTLSLFCVGQINLSTPNSPDL